MGFVRLDLGQLRLEGWSRAGEATWWRVHPPGLAFDVGRGDPRLSGSDDLFISHGHLDHALGVPFVLSNRTLHDTKPTRVFCPAPIADDLRSLVAAAERLEGVSYDWELGGLSRGDRIEVGREMLVEAFETPHVVPSLGYHLLRRRRRLKDELRSLPGPEIGRLRRSGESIDELVEERWLSYTGDCRISVFDEQPELYTTPVLLVECTFLNPGHRERGPRFGHVHFDDLVDRADRFENEVIVLHHLSRRHSAAQLRERVDRDLPDLAERIRIVGDSR